MAMTHTQALSKLAADTLVQTLEEDVARVMARTFALGRHDAAIAANYGGHALPPLLRRWSCVLPASRPRCCCSRAFSKPASCP